MPCAMKKLDRLAQIRHRIDVVDRRVARIVDIKCPSSGLTPANRWENIDLLTPRDEVKFVIAGRADYEFARGAAILAADADAP